MSQDATYENLAALGDEIFTLRQRVQVLNDLRATDVSCRELSIGITEIETGILWLQRVMDMLQLSRL